MEKEKNFTAEEKESLPAHKRAKSLVIDLTESPDSDTEESTRRQREKKELERQDEALARRLYEEELQALGNAGVQQPASCLAGMESEARLAEHLNAEGDAYLREFSSSSSSSAPAAAGVLGEEKPSKVNTSYWLYEGRTSANICGKWMLFYPVWKIDEAWGRAKEAFRKGDLKGTECMKVSTALPNPRATNDIMKVMIFYVACVREEEIMEVGRTVVRVMEFHKHGPLASFKTEEMTSRGTQATGCRQNSQYSIRTNYEDWREEHDGVVFVESKRGDADKAREAGLKWDPAARKSFIPSDLPEDEKQQLLREWQPRKGSKAKSKRGEKRSVTEEMAAFMAEDSEGHGEDGLGVVDKGLRQSQRQRGEEKEG
uniref:Uncharacterized protein n=1 Tax=Chromera velia CCMP2878 TaxID=1169474 RepID=A0A0G4FH26_9ALVE|mmetsp:Transcript_5822/g.11550  ORF Transcript_5822/g.11550 Transcript_5822/m.11550 type:complete len:371 (-) Transcript_5822:73-1185(-)|eukprot:Cvel_17007.t1-p1 / transcript=Cvel_17007.t1 / gene=Cvel_17007 / organism=Chromera_velia_CCMP2878 / gene_product=hypothetical protein / transcript_product=hypothetical protein / location=Cvel_scaffold1336:37750-38859(+) / protein_length=370 / sequence_SO=supercontig / SO=protein_coding / is_pseudo=false